MIIISVPSILIGVVELSLRWKFPLSFNFVFDICNDFKFLFIFIIGYGLQAADEHGMKDVIKKGRWYNFITGKEINLLSLFNPIISPGTLLLSIYSSRFIVEPEYQWTFWISCFLRGFAEWLFIIGIYGVIREIVTGSHAIIPVLSELSMPFYLTHQQVLVPIASICSWVPYLSRI